MATEKFGFVKDENSLQKVLVDGIKLKEIHIDVYPENPLNYSSSFMLLLRTSESNATISNNGDRIVFRRNDKNKTHFINLLSSKINECFFKTSENYFEFILNIQNIYYKLTILN